MKELEAQLPALQADADAHRKYHETKVAEVKTALGEAWDDSMATLSLESLEKIKALKAGVKPGGAPPAGAPGVVMPTTWQECLDDPPKMALAEKDPDLKARLKTAHQSAKRK